MQKDAVVSARVETDIKAEAESILRSLGVPVSVVINSLYQQIIFHKGIPFSLSIPNAPRTVDTMSNEELNEKLSRSYEQSVVGEGVAASAAFNDLEKDLP